MVRPKFSCAFLILMAATVIATGLGEAFARASGHDASASSVVRKKGPSAEQLNAAIENNERLGHLFSTFSSLRGATKVRPFADYESTGYVFINDGFRFDSQAVKEAIAKNLPADVTLVIFMTDASGSRATTLRKEFSKYLPADRLKLIELADASEGFWARDGLPVPVIEEATNALSLVDAQYYYPFEPDEEVGKIFGSPVSSHSFNFEGGNFMANHKGHCILVNNASHKKIPDAIFENLYGCKIVQRLRHVEGIGHIDEHVRFISEDTVLTDLEEYQKAIEAKGLKAVLLPRPQEELETYVNSLLVNGVVIVPTYGQKTDQQALDVYKAAGFKAVGVDSTSLSNIGQGSVHCITMTYPQVPFGNVLSLLKAKEVR